jgi:hypothetical protein
MIDVVLTQRTAYTLHWQYTHVLSVSVTPRHPSMGVCPSDKVLGRHWLWYLHRYGTAQGSFLLHRVAKLPYTARDTVPASLYQYFVFHTVRARGW